MVIEGGLPTGASWGGPAEKLVEAVRSAIGTLYEPTRIRRRAAAEGEALILATHADIEAAELLQRARERLLAQEQRRQENIDTIVAGSFDALPKQVSSNPVDPDWIAAFFDDCKDISSADLRELWSRLLALEVSIPSSSSRRTLSILRSLSSLEASIFARAVSLTWHSGDTAFIPQLGGTYGALSDYDLSFDDILELTACGLLSYGADICVEVNVGEEHLRYSGTQYQISVRPPGPALVPAIPMTRAGAELLAAMRPTCNLEFREKALLQIKASGVLISDSE